MQWGTVHEEAARHFTVTCHCQTHTADAQCKTGVDDMCHVCVVQYQDPPDMLLCYAMAQHRLSCILELNVPKRPQVQLCVPTVTTSSAVLHMAQWHIAALLMYLGTWVF